MYEAFYQLREKPFSILPDPDLIYWGKMHSMAFTMLEFGVMNNAGFTVITGEIGSGKTTLVRHLLKKISPAMTVGLISNSPQGRQELLQWILMSLGQPFEGDYPKLFKHLQDFLYGQYANGRRTILIIDEAQNLEPEALEHLRMISNINADKFQILQLILVGQPQLRDLLLAPNLHQFAQRISSDFHLRPLDDREVANYIAFPLTGGRCPRPLFTQEACTPDRVRERRDTPHDQRALRYRARLRLCQRQESHFRSISSRRHCRQATVQHFSRQEGLPGSLSHCLALWFHSLRRTESLPRVCAALIAAGSTTEVTKRWGTSHADPDYCAFLGPMGLGRERSNPQTGRHPEHYGPAGPKAGSQRGGRSER